MKTKQWIAAGIAALGVLVSCNKELVNYRQGDIKVVVKAGSAWRHDFPLFLGIKKKNTPQIAIWTEDWSGNYLATLYVTHKIATASWMTNGGNPRKEALPVWSHIRGGMPTKKEPVIDGISGATPQDDFDVKLIPTASMRRFVVKIEIDHSTDWNDHYARDARPGDAGYSGGSEGSGQPALVYEARVDLDSQQPSYTARLIGHSSPDGSDGRIYADTSTLTSALDIVEQITISIQ